MSKFTESLKSAFGRGAKREVPAKQVHRWEGEGGAMHPDEHDDHDLGHRGEGDGDVPGGGAARS
jgi:hypothetical protein